MKVKHLIKRLQELDPTGEIEVSVGNDDILLLKKKSASEDGFQQILIRDEAAMGHIVVESKMMKYDVVGVKLVAKGEKIVIYPHGVEDIFLENPDMPIDYSELSPSDIELYKKKHETIRKQYEKILNNFSKKKI